MRPLCHCTSCTGLARHIGRRAQCTQPCCMPAPCHQASYDCRVPLVSVCCAHPISSIAPRRPPCWGGALPPRVHWWALSSHLDVNLRRLQRASSGSPREPLRRSQKTGFFTRTMKPLENVVQGTLRALHLKPSGGAFGIPSEDGGPQEAQWSNTGFEEPI